MTRTRTAERLVTLVLVALAAAGIGALLATAIHRTAGPSSDGGVAGVTRDERTFTRARVFTPADVPAVLHRVSFTAHGGPVRVEWQAGSLAPRAPSTRADVALTVDGRPVATTVVEGETGIHEAQIPEILWAGRLSAGRHAIAVTLQATTGPVALPDDAGGRPALDRLTVTEFAGS